MRRKLIAVIAVQLVFNMYFLSITYGQIKFRADAETGYYRSTGTNILNQNNYFNALEGQLGYNYKNENKSAGIKLRIRPEFYGIDEQLTTLKIRGDASYQQSEKNFNWGFGINMQQYRFHGRNIDLNYNSFNLLFNSDWFIIPNFPLSLRAGYGFQKINNEGGQDLKMYLFNLGTSKQISEFSSIGAGIYLERFNISGEGINFFNNVTLNKGWRYGPQIVIAYIKDIIFNFEYRFLLHNSSLTNNISYEQTVRLVAGKLLSDEWSVFALVDLYFRKFRLNNQSTGNLNLIYNSMNIDDRIYVKLAYELNNFCELYLRSGYLKENLVNSRFSYSGLNTILGIEISN